VDESLHGVESVLHEKTMMIRRHELDIKLFDKTIIICKRGFLLRIPGFQDKMDVIAMKGVIKIGYCDPNWSIIDERDRFKTSTSCHLFLTLPWTENDESILFCHDGINQQISKMDPTFKKTVHEILSSVIKKKANRERIGECIWEESQNDHYPEEYARYLLYEVMVEMTIHAKVEDCIRYVKRRKMGWRHMEFNKFHLKQKEYDNFLLEPPEVEEGVIECHRCKSKKTFSFSKQTRSSDESATVFVRCAQCNHSFRM